MQMSGLSPKAVLGQSIRRRHRLRVRRIQRQPIHPLPQLRRQGLLAGRIQPRHSLDFLTAHELLLQLTRDTGDDLTVVPPRVAKVGPGAGGGAVHWGGAPDVVGGVAQEIWGGG